MSWCAWSRPKRISLDQALEFVRDDECVEVTPSAVRLRKVELNATGTRPAHQAVRVRTGPEVGRPASGPGAG